MGINWPSMSLGPGDASPEVASAIRAELDRLGDAISVVLQSKSLPPYVSPLFRQWSLFAYVQPGRVVAIFFEQVGTARLVFMDAKSPPLAFYSPEQIAGQLSQELGMKVISVIVLDPLESDASSRDATLTRLAHEHVAQIEREALLGKLGDLSSRPHLEPHLRQFLADHPDHEKNVFIMMRFQATAQFEELHRTIVDTLAGQGLRGLRADDREYHPDLWDNIEIYMLGCKFGIAVFEDFEARDHNPNVALELGYMRARDRRCLILKERTLPSVPTDVVGTLYKAFDKFSIAPTVSAQVERWVTVDLGYT